MKSFAKFLLVGAVVMMAIAVSAAPSEAAKKKKMKGPAAGTYFGQVCATDCSATNLCKVMFWGYDNKWYPAAAAVPPVCQQPFCPAAC